MKTNNTIILAFALGALAVIMGAFGAHALEEGLRASGYFETYQTASKYHFWHTLLLLLLGILREKGDNNWLSLASVFTIVGIAIFSGSLYVLSLMDISWLGAITPIGGLLLIASWISGAVGYFRSRRQ